MYALVIDNEIQSVGGLPLSARRLDTGEWVMGLRDASVEMQELCGYKVVVEVDRPTPSASDKTFDMTIELTNNIPTTVWTERDMTVDELAAQTESSNQIIIENAINDALATLDTLIAAPAIDAVPAGTMTTAQLSNAMRILRDAAQANRAGAQTIALTLKRTIRLVRGDFDATN